jgi:hypothetical protein
MGIMAVEFEIEDLGEIVVIGDSTSGKKYSKCKGTLNKNLSQGDSDEPAPFIDEWIFPVKRRFRADLFTLKN